MKKVNKLIMLLLLVTIVGQPLGLSASQVGSALSENSASELVLSETSSEKKQSSITEPQNGSEAGVESSVKTQVTPQSSESNSEVNSEKSEETQKSNQEKPTISGVNNIEVAYDSNFDVKKGITAKAGNGQNITNLIKVTDEVDTKKAGHVYELSYSVTDPSNKQVTTVNRKVTVGTTKDTVENGVYKREIYKENNLVQINYYYGKSYDDAHIKEEQVYYSNGEMKLKRYNQNRKCTSIEARNSSGIRTNTKKYDGKDSKPVAQYYYHTNGKVKTKYVYYKTGSSKYTRNDYNTDGKITKSTRYYTNNKRQFYKEYFTNGRDKKAIYYNTDGKITKSTRYYTNNKRQFYKEYFTNGRVKKAIYYNTSGKFTSVESWNGSGKRTKTQKYDGKGFKTVEYHYHENDKVKAKYTYYKSGVVKYIRVDYNQTGVKTAFTKYDRKNNTLFKKTFFSNGKVNKSYQEHIAKNGVKTGITEKWYYSNGKLKKVDARTFPTYYSQYNSYYKNFSCPAYNGNMYKHGCIMNSMSMFYSVYNNDELTPLELYSQGYKCFFDVPAAFSRNGLDVDKVNVAGSKHNAYTKFYNTGGHVPNGKKTFTIEEALVDYGMPVQLMMRSNGHMSFNFPGHSIMAYRYVYENGKETIYAKNPGAKGGTVKLQSYMDGEYHEVGATYYIIKNGWVGNLK